MTLPRLAALNRRWAELPPAAVALSRIARWLGAAPAPAVKQDPIAAARRAGIPVADHLPDDPLLAFLDDRIGLGMTTGRGTEGLRV